jgi:Na+/H+ antiporter NhaD/arsenite permease-like protein
VAFGKSHGSRRGHCRLSNLVSNVPAVLVLSPFVGRMGNRELAWLTVAMALTLAGNFTIQDRSPT